MNPQLLHQQALLAQRQRQQQQIMNGMSVGNPSAMAAFQNQNGGAPQMRAPGLPNGMYSGGGPGGVPGGNITAFTAGNPQLRGMIPPQIQHQLQQQQHQQNQIAAAQQYTMASQAAAQGNPQAAAMNMPQQGQMGTIQQQHVLAQRAAASVAAAAQYVHRFSDIIGVHCLMLTGTPEKRSVYQY